MTTLSVSCDTLYGNSFRMLLDQQRLFIQLGSEDVVVEEWQQSRK
ncbi:hypothetical protein ACFLFF_22510 [Brevibacillus reuszeri]|nr:hypothetical protein [Brevibacillus reuszeri]